MVWFMSLPVNLDSLKTVSGALLVAVAVFAYYQLLQDSSFVLRFAVLLAGVAAGVGLMCWSKAGGIFLGYLGDARTELRKVVWPTRQQALQMVMLVMAMVVVVAIFLGLLDWMLSSLMGWFLG